MSLLNLDNKGIIITVVYSYQKIKIIVKSYYLYLKYSAAIIFCGKMVESFCKEGVHRMNKGSSKMH